MEIYEVSGSAPDKLRQVIEEGLGEKVAKNVQFKSTDKGVNITYAVGGSGPVTFSIDLEEAKDGSVTFDPKQLEALQKKIAEDFGDVFDFSFLSDDTIKGAVQSSIDEFVEKYGNKAFSNTYLCIFAILRILQDSAEKLKKAAIESREAERKNEVEAIKNQAAQEKDAALTGLLVSIAVTVVQVHNTINAGVAQVNTMTAQDNVVKNDPTVKTANEIMDNTRLVNDPPVKANTAMQEASRGLSHEQQAKIINDLGGYGEKDLAKLSETPRGKLETTFSELKKTSAKGTDGKPKTDAPKAEKTPETKAPKAEASEKKAPTAEEFEKQKKEYLKKLDAGVEEYKTKYEKANKEYQRELGRKNPDQKKLAELRGKCDTARKEYVFANATRTAAIANGPGGKPMLDEDGREGMIAEAEDGVKMAEYTVRNSDTGKFKTLEIAANTYSKTMDAVNTLLGGLPSFIQQMMREKATLMEADRKIAEGASAQAQDVVSAAKETQGKLIKMFDTVTESNINSARLQI